MICFIEFKKERDILKPRPKINNPTYFSDFMISALYK